MTGKFYKTKFRALYEALDYISIYKSLCIMYLEGHGYTLIVPKSVKYNHRVVLCISEHTLEEDLRRNLNILQYYYIRIWLVFNTL